MGKSGFWLIGLWLALSPLALAEEGFWTFARFPSAAMTAAQGWAPDGAWIARASKAAARLESGCSGAVVSGEGLVLSNHHCVAACLEDASAPGEHLIEAGFVAHARTEERRCPGLVVSVLESETDVTDAMSAAARASPDENFAAIRDAEALRLVRACEAAGPSRSCELVTLYGGARYALDAFRIYTDVRLVFAPERAIAHFGGEADNFSFPRTAFDVALVRLYADGAPARTPDRLSLRATPLTAGESLIAMGSPGATERLMTHAELLFEAGTHLPLRLALLRGVRDRLATAQTSAGEDADAIAGQLFAAENLLKSFEGRLAGASDAAVQARNGADEADLRARVARNAATQRTIGGAWDEIAAALTRYRSFHDSYELLEARFGEGSMLLTSAHEIVRGAGERARPEGDRLPSFNDLRLVATRTAALARPLPPAAIERARIAAWAAVATARLPATNAVRRAIAAAGGPDALAQTIVTTSGLTDPDARSALWNEGADAVAISSDPAIALARVAETEARAAAVRYRADVELPMATARVRIAEARYRAFGPRLYPDATRTPRLSYGRIEGWSEAGRDVAPMTTLGDLFARPAASALAPAWLNARAALGDGSVMNAALSADSIAGSSGSAVLDREGEVAAIVFDGNLAALYGVYAYDGARHRTIVLAAPLVLSALERVYGLGDLAREMRGE